MQMPLAFQNKARTLILLEAHLKSATIAPLVAFTVAEWRKSPKDVLRRLDKELPSGLWIVRSSCWMEDSKNASNAGVFLSRLNVSRDVVASAINDVISSYPAECQYDDVLVQPMLSSVIRSGVAFSHDPNTCAPYRVINWVEGSNTEFITGGLGGRVWQAAADSPISPIIEIKAIVHLIEELETLFGGLPVDCEFAVTKDASDREIVWLLQARPLILSRQPETSEVQRDRLELIEKKLSRNMREHMFIKGASTAYGVMPDWNPAEMIGLKPRPLALSLYRDLITDSIWAYQRNNYGYRNLRSFPLMPHFFGLPYIDVRLSFNSFIPAPLEDSLAERLVDYYLECLNGEPSLHDKVEFEIVFSCYTLDLSQRMEKLVKHGFSHLEISKIANCLRDLTNKIIDPRSGLWRSDALKLDMLESRRQLLLTSDADSLERIYWLLEDGKRYGTLPFAGLARAGFIAVQLLQSLVSVGVLSIAEYELFMVNITTTGGSLSKDRANLDRISFLAKYGHLRPGTYDLLSPRYDEAPDLYFDWSRPVKAVQIPESFSISPTQMTEIVRLLEIHGLKPDAKELFNFIQAGIELREQAKFQFTRNVSEVLSLASRVGEDYGFSREDIAYCDISVFKEMHIAAIDPRDALKAGIERGQSLYENSLALALPPMITKPSDVWSFEWPTSTPNFITQKKVTGQVMMADAPHRSLEGAIVCILSADPGFDWLFSYPIAGLITAWGGANSHMAIRAGELGLPAVIGAGEILYKRWSKAFRLHLDCAEQRVEILA